MNNKQTSRRKAFESASEWARWTTSLATNRLLLVVAARKRGEPFLFHVQGNLISDYIWENKRAQGWRFRALRAYQFGREVSIPLPLRKGYPAAKPVLASTN